MDKKNYLLELLVLASMILAACSGQPLGLSVPATFQCDDAIGCVDIAPDEPVHIAFFLATSGPDESLGIDARNGIEIAVEDKGQILGHEILLTGEDEAVKPEGGFAATKLTADPSIIAVIGTSTSDAARDGVPLVSQAGLIIVSPSNSDFELTEQDNENNYPGYARTAPNNKFQGFAAAKFAIDVLGARKAATINDGSLYGKQLQDVFIAEFQEMGGIITAQKNFDPEKNDINEILMGIADGEPELIFYPVHIKAGSLITRQARETAGLENTHLMGADRMFSQDFFQIAEDSVEGLYVTGPDYTEFDESYSSGFLPKYREKFAIEPVNIYHAHAYDAFMLIANAIEEVAVQDLDGTLHIPHQELREALYQTNNFQGLTGNITCTPSGDCANARIAIYQYHQGQFPPEKVWP